MYIKINNKNIKIKELTSFKEKVKSFKFYFDKIDFGIKVSNKKIINTIFFCQKVDVIVTDDNEKILFLHEGLRSEKIKIHFKGKNIYYMPLGTVKNLKINDTLKLECKKYS